MFSLSFSLNLDKCICLYFSINYLSIKQDVRTNYFSIPRKLFVRVPLRGITTNLVLDHSSHQQETSTWSSEFFISCLDKARHVFEGVYLRCSFRFSWVLYKLISQKLVKVVNMSTVEGSVVSAVSSDFSQRTNSLILMDLYMFT